MTSSYLDDEDKVFYGGERDRVSSKAERSEEVRQEKKPTEKEEEKAEPTEEEIDAQIAQTRADKRKTESVHDIAVLRERAAVQSTQAAKYYKKYRAEEATQVKHEQKVNKFRRQSEKYLEKVKNVEVKIADKEASLSYIEGGKLERAHVKIAKLKGKIAKLKSKASKAESNAAKNRQKALARKQKATGFLEKSKIHEGEAKSYRNRADKLERVS